MSGARLSETGALSDPSRPNRRAHGWAHDCARCGKGAAFGFTQRDGGTLWYCGAHRALGRAVPPPRMPRIGHGRKN
ncbi:hypothetical protein A0U89_14815 (plasmid) [Kozakia baliensis]|uniref:Uncharacterized protein n=1 Tax=Kozakia baliensis TaxID=153496 RepID=A0A1D8UYC9_9PROT|nr:hypothetical protein [Kozakia baliensis]AOX18557.1 hypothetical protein A0U89_14815 [Kozakia baliensis]